MSTVIVLSDSDEPASPCARVARDEDDECATSEVSQRNDFDAAEYKSLDLQTQDLQDDPNVDDIDEYARGLPSACRDSEDSDIERPIGKRVSRAKTSKCNKTEASKERVKRQRALAREKTLRTIATKRSRNAKPGECIKFMTVDLDRGIDAFPFATDIKDTLVNANVDFNVTAQLIPNSITWRRNVEEDYLDEDGEVHTKRNVTLEKQIIVVWSNLETVRHVAEGTLCATLLDNKALLLNHNITLIIFGMEEYFAYKKSIKRKHNDRDNWRSTELETSPVISRQQLKMCLTKAQIVVELSSRLIESAQDLALTVYQYTKSIGEMPYKLQKREQLESNFEWYIMGDNRNTVRVDKDGNGSKRLWQQQLRQFNMCNLDMAEAICTAYPSPMQLIEAYRHCTPDEGTNLLKNISVRRVAGPLTAVRKIGPELSKKIYVMFTSQDGDVLLGTEE